MGIDKVLEDFHAKLDAILEAVNAKTSDKPAAEKPAAKPKEKAAAKPKEEKAAEPLELEDAPLDDLFDAPAAITPEEAADKCRKISDGVTDKKAFRTAFIELLKNKFNVDSLGKVPVERLAELMSEVEKIGTATK